MTEVVRLHGEDCGCTRCVGFTSSNGVGLRHGAYAELRLGERVQELAPALEELVPSFRPSDAPTVAVLALAFARLEAASAALKDAGPEELQRLRQDERGWANTTIRLLDALGLSPSSRARILRDAAIGQDAGLRAQEALAEHVAATYGDGS